MHLETIHCSDITFFLQSLISTTIASCPENFINLSAILVEVRMADYGCKLMRFANRGKWGHHRVAQTPVKFRQKGLLRIGLLLQDFAHRVPVH